MDFAKSRSTTDATFKFVNDIYTYENIKRVTSAIFSDYKKAFDSISHNIILARLKMYNLSNSSIQWLESYLLDHKQRTNIDGDVSG